MKKRPVDGEPDSPLHLHFIGIGGIGMSGIAEVFFNQGYEVSGSDAVEGDTTRRLAALGLKISIGHRPENIDGANVVVYSSAVKPTNPEFSEAKKRSIPLIPRAEALGELMRGKIGIALAGTHGKTTTTTLLSTILAGCGLDPTIVIGGKVDAFGGNAKLGQGDYVVAEADESDGSFLFLPAVYGAITNIDADHLDHYGDLAKIDDAFCAFVSRIPFYGRVYVCGDDPGVRRNLARFSKPYRTYGLAEENHLQARSIEETIEGTSFEVRDLTRGSFGRISFAAHGAHNIRNALAAIGIALDLGIPFSEISRSLGEYRGVRRRFELRYDDPSRGIRIFDDYGHHPTEISATLETARSVHALSGRPGRILVAFQPHRYSRTLNSMREFSDCFAGVDALFLTDVYAAGEEPIVGASGLDLFRKIQDNAGKNPKISVFAESLDKCAELIAKEIHNGDLVLCMGAGSVTRLPDLIRERLMKGLP